MSFFLSFVRFTVQCKIVPPDKYRCGPHVLVHASRACVQETDMRVYDRLSAHLGILKKQFSRPTAAGGDGIDLTSDGYSDFFAFSTGRRNISSLHTVFALRPRHDFFQLAIQIARGLVDLLYAPKDEVTLDFKLHTTVAIPEFVWALVAKGEASAIKKERWDLVSQS
jgi:PAT complex subunit CCDC47